MRGAHAQDFPIERQTAPNALPRKGSATSNSRTPSCTGPYLLIGVAQGRRYSASAATPYCTETVTPFWLKFPPIATVIGRSPDPAFAGICTLSCINPAANPGASPAYV